jgi:hypothetical protein
MAHSDCQSFTKPNKSLSDPDILAQLNANGLGLRYHWNQERDITERFMVYALHHDITIMRMFPLFSRPEAHSFVEHVLGDCLHYCKY